MKETKSEQKAQSHSLGQGFLQERFLKALFVQTFYEKITWRQTDSFFQAQTGVYRETWETVIGGIRITLRYFQIIEIAGGFFKKCIKMGKEQVDIDLIHPEITYGLSFFEVGALSLQLYREIKDQRDRETRKWHSKHPVIDHSIDASEFGNLLVSLTNALGILI